MDNPRNDTRWLLDQIWWDAGDVLRQNTGSRTLANGHIQVVYDKAFRNVFSFEEEVWDFG